MMGFETITLSPIDLALVEVSLLTADERDWLNAYHARVRDKLLPLVDGETAAWLSEGRTRPRMIVEMRTYKLKPGLRTRFLEIFRTKSAPAHYGEIGMKLAGPFLSIEDEDTFFFMRGFPDLGLVRDDEGAVLRRAALEERTRSGVDADDREIRGDAVEAPEARAGGVNLRT